MEAKQIFQRQCDGETAFQLLAALGWRWGLRKDTVGTRRGLTARKIVCSWMGLGDAVL